MTGDEESHGMTIEGACGANTHELSSWCEYVRVVEWGENEI